MGQAKRRGTFEERKESAILRDQEIERKRKVVESFREKICGSLKWHCLC